MSEVWGHRGWPVRYPDNVLAGIRAAGSVAARVEIDVRRSLDGELVLSHDPEVGGLVVAETGWSRLAGIDLGDGHRPIRLQDLFEQAPDVRLNIEIKSSPFEPGFEPDLGIADDVAMICRPDDVITSFYWPIVARVREVRPASATGLLFEAGIPVEDAIEHAGESGHVAIVPHWPLVTGDVIDRAHDAGLRVVTWTVDDPGVATRLARDGIDAIITNDPGAIAAVLQAEPSEWTP